MENPATWKRAELIIRDAYNHWVYADSHGVIGLSLAGTIAQALRDNGLLNDQNERLWNWGEKDALDQTHRS